MVQRLRILCCAALALSFAAPAPAGQEPEKKAADAPKGAWKRMSGDFTLTFDFKKENMVTFKMVNGAGDGMTFDASYKQGEDGKLTLTVKEAKAIGTFDAGPTAGEEYSFRLKIAGEKMTLSDLKKGDGSDVEPEAQQLVQGDYSRAED